MTKVLSANPRPCIHCPWRIANYGKPHQHNFYSRKNLLRLWNGLRTGEAPGMTCHPTDPAMAEYEGYEATADCEATHECAGAVVIVVRELMRFQAICIQIEQGQLEGNALKLYRDQAGTQGMTRGGLAETVSRFLLGGTPLARAIKANSEQVNDPEIGHPFTSWDPDILPIAMRRT